LSWNKAHSFDSLYSTCRIWSFVYLPSLYGAPHLTCWRQQEIRRRNSPASGLRNL